MARQGLLGKLKKDNPHAESAVDAEPDDESEESAHD